MGELPSWCHAGPGTREWTRLPVAQWPDGSDMSLWVCVIRGRVNGPILYLQAGLHGEELTGVEIVRRVCYLLDPSELVGTVIAVPVANPAAFVAVSRWIPWEDRGPIDMNRCFGQSSPLGVTGTIARTIFEQIVIRSDYCIDLHSGRANNLIEPFSIVVRTGSQLHDEVVEGMAEAYGAKFVNYYDGKWDPDFGNTLFVAANVRGIPTLGVEAGEGARITEEYVSSGTAGVQSVMRRLGMLRKGEGTEPGLHRPSVRFQNTTWVRSSTSGLVRLLAGPGEFVREGSPLATVGILGGEECVVTAPVSGYVVQVYTGGVAHPGTVLARLVQAEAPGWS